MFHSLKLPVFVFALSLAGTSYAEDPTPNLRRRAVLNERPAIGTQAEQTQTAGLLDFFRRSGPYPQNRTSGYSDRRGYTGYAPRYSVPNGNNYNYNYQRSHPSLGRTNFSGQAYRLSGRPNYLIGRSNPYPTSPNYGASGARCPYTGLPHSSGYYYGG